MAEPRFDITDKNDVGRPSKFTAEEIQEIYEDFSDYIKRTADPTVVGFTSYYDKYEVRKTYLNDRQEFSELIKKAIEKQEAYLVAGAVQNKLNATMAIFRLKQPQHGYKDRTEQDITSNGESLSPVLVKFMGDNADTASKTD